MYYYNIDLSEFKSSRMIDAYIDYLFSKNDLSTTLQSLGISKSSYFYAKKNGYTNSPKFMATIIERGFYKKFTDDQYNSITNTLRASITESYFADNERLQTIRKDFLKRMNSYDGTVLEIVAKIIYLNSLDLPITDNKQLEEVKSNIDVVSIFKNTMSANTAYLFLLSISEFYQASRDVAGMKKTMEEMILLEPQADEHLLLLGYYDMIGMETMLGGLKQSYYYLNKCEDLCYKYANFKRLAYLRGNKRFIAYRIGNYEQASALAASDIVSLLRGDDPIMLCTTIVILVNSLIALKRYDEALEYNHLFYTQKITDYYIHAILFEAYISYKINPNTVLDSYFTEIEKYNTYPLYNDGLNLLNALKNIQKSTRRSMKEAATILRPIDEQKYSRLNSIAGHLRKELESYLVSNGKMLSIYDMI